MLINPTIEVYRHLYNFGNLSSEMYLINIPYTCYRVIMIEIFCHIYIKRNFKEKYFSVDVFRYDYLQTTLFVLHIPVLNIVIIILPFHFESCILVSKTYDNFNSTTIRFDITVFNSIITMRGPVGKYYFEFYISFYLLFP